MVHIFMDLALRTIPLECKSCKDSCQTLASLICLLDKSSNPSPGRQSAPACSTGTLPAPSWTLVHSPTFTHHRIACIITFILCSLLRAPGTAASSPPMATIYSQSCVVMHGNARFTSVFSGRNSNRCLGPVGAFVRIWRTKCSLEIYTAMVRWIHGSGI